MNAHSQDIELLTLPSLTQSYLRAVRRMVSESLTFKHGFSHVPKLPTKRLVLKNYRLNPTVIKQYTTNTQLSERSVLPLTYLFSLTFPMVMKLLTEPDFPYAPVGLVHLYNTINQYQAVAVDAKVDIYVHVENLREHRSGLLFDVVTEVYIGTKLVWSQISAMLHKQKTSLSSGPREQVEKIDKTKVSHQQTITATADIIRGYASISGDRNPIHMSAVVAKLFGFPQMIAHGSWMMARILSGTEEQLPVACSYNIRFGKPFLVPGSAELLVAQSPSGQEWAYSLEKAKKESIILTAKVASIGISEH